MITLIDPLFASIKGWNEMDLFSQLKKLFFYEYPAPLCQLDGNFSWSPELLGNPTKTDLRTFSHSFSQLYNMKYIFVFFKLK